MQKRTQKEKRSSCVGFGAKFIAPKEILAAGKVVYRIIFDTGYFYIGSTNSLAKRVRAFQRAFKWGLHLSKKFKEAVEASETATIEVLEGLTYEHSLRYVEEEYIRPHAGDPMLINRSISAKSNLGIRWTPEERRLVSQNGKGIPRLGSGRKKRQV